MVSSEHPWKCLVSPLCWRLVLSLTIVSSFMASSACMSDSEQQARANAVPATERATTLAVKSFEPYGPMCSKAETTAIEPSIMVEILVTNKAHSLPYFFGQLEALDYPKKRLRLFIRTGGNIDGSLDIIRLWVSNVSHLYHDIDFKYSESGKLAGTSRSKYPYNHIKKHRQDALNEALSNGADFYFSIHPEVVLLNPATLRRLVDITHFPPKNIATSGGITVIAPMLNCSTSRYFSNFWGDMTSEGHYKRSFDYFDIQQRHSKGIFPVAMVHTALLINLRQVSGRNLTVNSIPPDIYGPYDDLILFAKSAQAAGVKLYLDNREFYGYFPKPVEEVELTSGDFSSIRHLLSREVEHFIHLKLQVNLNEDVKHQLASAACLNYSDYLPVQPAPSKLGFDEIYLINLERRPERLRKMQYSLQELGINATLFKAVDGIQLTNEKLMEMNIKQLTGYADPYHKRPLKFGEIGCFLSHYMIWNDVVLRKYRRVLILEDDLRFAPGYTRRLNETLAEADLYEPHWDLLYIGRKRMSGDDIPVRGARLLVHPGYTYWTLSYALQARGAKKLLDQHPLQRMLAVDEYLSILFNRHPNKGWLAAFAPRSLVALSAEPSLVEPIYYTGQPRHTSDTESSGVIFQDDIQVSLK